MNKFGKIIISWIGVLLWMGVIYYFSSQPDLKSELEPMWDLIFRKIAHMAEFFILAYLFFNAYKSLGASVGKALIFAFMFSVAYAGFDEWHQSQVAGRVASIVDIGIDSVGILLYVLLKLQKKPVEES